jgi:hypothetical protein
MLARLDIEYLHRVIAQRGDEQPLAFQIGTEMIDSPIDLRQVNPGRER